MAQEPLATRGNFLHIYDFRVKAGHEAEFIRSFEVFDYSDGNPMHKSAAQVKDGVLCRDTEDPQRFFLIAEWADIEEHAKIRSILANEIKPEFIKYIEGGRFVPKYVEVVSSTPERSDIGRRAGKGGRGIAIWRCASPAVPTRSADAWAGGVGAAIGRLCPPYQK
jgi:hypothetical protein